MLLPFPAVIRGRCRKSAPSRQVTPRIHPTIRSFPERVDGRVKSGNDLPGNGAVTSASIILHILPHAPIPSPPDRLSHRGNGGDAVSAWRTGPHRRRFRLCGAATAGQAREAAGIGLHLGRHSENPERSNRTSFSPSRTCRRTSSPIWSAPGLAVHVFNQRDVAGILAMIRTLGALVGAAERADQLATGYERRLAAHRIARRGPHQGQRFISRNGTIP